MRSFTVFLLALVTVAVAEQLPSCATACVAKAIEKTGCASSDTQCLCESEHYLGFLRHCSTKRCDKADKSAAIQSVNDICGLVTHKESVPLAPDESLRIQARDRKHGEKNQKLKPSVSAPHRAYYSSPSNPSYYSSPPNPSFYSSPPNPSYYSSPPNPSYYSSPPNPSYYSQGPVQSDRPSYSPSNNPSDQHNGKWGRPFYRPAPNPSYYSHVPVATVL